MLFVAMRLASIESLKLGWSRELAFSTFDGGMFMARFMIVTGLAAVLLTAAGEARAADKLFVKGSEFLPDFAGQPMWILAARCAAFSETWDEYLVLEKAETKAPATGAQATLNDVYATALLDGGRKDRAFWTRFGVARLRRDRPAEPAEATFEAQVARELAQHRAARRTVKQYSDYDDNCRAYLNAINWVAVRMDRGWADQD